MALRDHSGQAHSGPFSPRSDEAGSSGPAGAQKSMLAVDALSNDDLTGIAQTDLQHHQEHWVKYNSLQEAQPVPFWTQQESVMAQASSGFGQAHRGHLAQPQDPALPVSACLTIVQAPAAYFRPIVQKKTFKPPFVVRMELQHKGHMDLMVTMTASVINDTQYNKPGGWTPASNPGQPDLEACSISRHLQDPSVHAAGQGSRAGRQQSALQTHVEDFEFTDLLFVKSSRMSKRWLLFSCIIREELIFVIYKLPTVIISRRTDQYSKAYESLMGQPALQGPPFKSRASSATARAPAPHPPPPSSAGVGPYPRLSPLPSEGIASDRMQPPSAYGHLDQQADHVDERQISSWIVRTYSSMGFRRALTEGDVSALQGQLAVGQGHSREGSPRPVSPDKWEDFKQWFFKCTRALKQCEREWNEVEPCCMCGFAMERGPAEVMLWYHPPGTFLIRICQEPGSFAVSCRVAPNPEDAPPGDPSAGVEHLLVDCVDLHSQPLWGWVRAWPLATHLLDPHTHQLHPKEQLFLGHNSVGPGGSSGKAMDIDQILMLAARQHSQATAQRAAPDHAGGGKEEAAHAHTANGAHWGWSADQGPQNHHQAPPARPPGPPDSGVAALLASLRGQIGAARQQQGLLEAERGALPSRVLDGHHGHGSLQHSQMQPPEHQ